MPSAHVKLSYIVQGFFFAIETLILTCFIWDDLRVSSIFFLPFFFRNVQSSVKAATGRLHTFRKQNRDSPRPDAHSTNEDMSSTSRMGLC
jgi:hypothetical protein